MNVEAILAPLYQLRSSGWPTEAEIKNLAPPEATNEPEDTAGKPFPKARGWIAAGRGHLQRMRDSMQALALLDD